MTAGFHSATQWGLWALSIGLLAGQTDLGRAQEVGQSTVVPYRGDRAENPPPAGNVPRSYGPVEAGQDAYQWAEQERREAISRQLLVEDAIAYDHAPAAYYWSGPPVSAVQVWSGRRGYRYVYRPPYVYPGSLPLGWLESWPFVTRDIYRYPYLYRIPQPWGHEAVVIGPRTTLVRPLYSAPPQARPPSGSALPPPDGDVPRPMLRKPAPPASGAPERIPTPPAAGRTPVPPPPPAPGAGDAREF